MRFHYLHASTKEMNEARLSQLHDELVNGKSQRGKYGGIGAGTKKTKFIGAIIKDLSGTKSLPDTPLYRRFVAASKKQLCRHTVVTVLEAQGGSMRWMDLVRHVADECKEQVTEDFKCRVLINIPSEYLSRKCPSVRIV